MSADQEATLKPSQPSPKFLTEMTPARSKQLLRFIDLFVTEYMVTYNSDRSPEDNYFKHSSPDLRSLEANDIPYLLAYICNAQQDNNQEDEIDNSTQNANSSKLLKDIVVPEDSQSVKDKTIVAKPEGTINHKDGLNSVSNADNRVTGDNTG